MGTLPKNVADYIIDLVHADFETGQCSYDTVCRPACLLIFIMMTNGNACKSGTNKPKQKRQYIAMPQLMQIIVI